MNRRQFLQAASGLAVHRGLTGASEPDFLSRAEALKPQLRTAQQTPLALVRALPDKAASLQWRIERLSDAAAIRDRVLRRGDSAVLDFGEHLTGYLKFSIAGEGRGVDAPARLKLTFGEVPAEIAEPFDPYTGTLSRAWLQDEVINIDALPATIGMPRRYAFRYLKIDVIDTSPNYGVRFGAIEAQAVSSAAGNPPPLPRSTSDLLRDIDRISIATLRDCMQTVFEDGPKRDRRLWIGDLRLQALTNAVTFRNFDLVRRCLYLFAAFPREDGLVPACVFEHPVPARGHEYIVDYAALYAAAVVDYAHASGDWSTARELWPVVRRQMEILGTYVRPDGIFSAPRGSWVFIDWSEVLDRTAAMHGVFIYSLRYALELAETVGARREVAEYRAAIGNLTRAARSSFYDASRGVFVSGPKGQVSLASQAWMVLAGVVSDEPARAALQRAMDIKEAVRPGAPYLYHYVVDALLHCGMKQEARSLIESYWGGMVRAGADTFWEVYDPANPRLSPYGSVLVNSYCHAWSCTPAYLLRKYQLS